MADIIKNAPTMTTREIAELTGKAHAHVLRDADAMLEALDEKGRSKFGSTYQDAQGKERRELRLPKRETLILVSGYDVAMRAKIIDRLDELERQTTAPAQISREASKGVRKDFAGTLKKHGVRRGGYRDCTNAQYIQLTGKDADGLREHFGVKRNLRDAFDGETRLKVAFAELAAQKKIERDRSWGNEECADACASAARSVAEIVGGDLPARGGVPRIGGAQ